MDKFIVILQGGNEGDFFEYPIVVEAKSKFEVEHKMLIMLEESNGIRGLYFETFEIYTLNEWLDNNTCVI